jgi:glycosyltransferase involved in cell wall biosynthesis
MYSGLHITAIIPALNEEDAIGQVVSDLLKLKDNEGLTIIDQVIVGDNGSTDKTAHIAENAGALVIFEPKKGYGAACQAALKHIDKTDIVVFVDGDCSIVVGQTLTLLEALADGADLVIGSRVKGYIEPGAMSWPQHIGNGLIAGIIAKLWQAKVTDLGPFRAIRYQALLSLGMQDQTYGWTVEMQAKALQHHLIMSEVPVDCRVRIGQSKVSGTIRGVIGAAYGMLSMVFKLRWQESINKPKLL